MTTELIPFPRIAVLVVAFLCISMKLCEGADESEGLKTLTDEAAVVVVGETTSAGLLGDSPAIPEVLGAANWNAFVPPFAGTPTIRVSEVLKTDEKLGDEVAFTPVSALALRTMPNSGLAVGGIWLLRRTKKDRVLWAEAVNAYQPYSKLPEVRALLGAKRREHDRFTDQAELVLASVTNLTRSQFTQPMDVDSLAATLAAAMPTNQDRSHVVGIMPIAPWINSSQLPPPEVGGLDTLPQNMGLGKLFRTKRLAALPALRSKLNQGTAMEKFEVLEIFSTYGVVPLIPDVISAIDDETVVPASGDVIWGSVGHVAVLKLVDVARVLDGKTAKQRGYWTFSLDGREKRSAVRKDWEAWWEKVRSGSIAPPKPAD